MDSRCATRGIQAEKFFFGPAIPQVAKTIEKSFSALLMLAALFVLSACGGGGGGACVGRAWLGGVSGIRFKARIVALAKAYSNDCPARKAVAHRYANSKRGGA